MRVRCVCDLFFLSATLQTIALQVFLSALCLFPFCELQTMTRNHEFPPKVPFCFDVGDRAVLYSYFSKSRLQYDKRVHCPEMSFTLIKNALYTYTKYVYTSCCFITSFFASLSGMMFQNLLCCSSELHTL